MSENKPYFNNNFEPIRQLIEQARATGDGKLPVMWLNSKMLADLTAETKDDPDFLPVAYGKDGEVAFIFDCKIEVSDELKGNVFGVLPYGTPLTSNYISALNQHYLDNQMSRKAGLN